MQVQRVTSSDHVNKVIKKTSPSGRLTVCMGQRDFIDYYTHMEIIDGVVEIELEKMRNSDVVMLCVTATFRYGRDDAESMGMDFRKEIFKCSQQIYPVVRKRKLDLSAFQEKLVDRMGDKAFPFMVELPRGSPASVSLQVEPGEPGKPCGVDYELRCYVTDDTNQEINPKDVVAMAIRKLTYAPYKSDAPAPAGEIVKDFKGGAGKFRLEMTLDREIYYHGETIQVNVTIHNSSNKTARRIKLSIIQVAEIMLHRKTSYKRAVAEMDSEDGFPLHSGQLGFCRTYHIIPTLNRSRDKIGLALDGKLKYEDTGLASSTIVHNENDRDNLGIIISYLVRAKLTFGIGTSDVILEVPFTLSHPSKYPANQIPAKPRDDVTDDRLESDATNREDVRLFDEFSRNCRMQEASVKF